MKRILSLSTLFIIVTHLLLSAQSYKAAQNYNLVQNVVTFDKLTKTIIPLDAPSRPSVQITPALTDFSIEEQNGRFSLVVPKVVPQGQYTIVSASSRGKDTLVWKVLPSTLEPKSMKTLAGTKFYYGKRFALRSKLLPEAELPLQQFKIAYRFRNDDPANEHPYTESFVGPNIPASTQNVYVEIAWVYPPTGERVILFSRTAILQQMPPEIAYSNAVAEFKSYDAAKNITYISIKGISVDYEVPIDADNTDITASKSLKATLNDVEAEPVAVDYSSSDTQILPYTNGERDVVTPWYASAQSVSLVENSYDQGTGNFQLTLAIAGITPSSTELRGTIAFKAKASILNRKAGVSANTTSPPCVIPINIPVNQHLQNEQRARLIKEVQAAYTPTVSKPVRLSGDEFLRRQLWLSERIKTLRFSVVSAGEPLVKSVRNVVNPAPERTPALETAEQECTNTDDIKKRIQKKQPVPQTLIDEGGSPTDCETVKKFYSALASHESIAHVVILAETAQDGSLGQILGALALRGTRGNRLVISDEALASPLKIWTAEETKALALGGGSLYDALLQEITTINTQTKSPTVGSIQERKVTIETTEFVPLTKKSAASSKGAAKKTK